MLGFQRMSFLNPYSWAEEASAGLKVKLTSGSVLASAKADWTILQKMKAVYMVKAKRVSGEREAPNLPSLKQGDIKMFMWKGITKATWTLKEAAYYVNEEDPDYSEKKISPQASNNVSKTYMWLLQEVSQNKLHPIPYGDEDEKTIFSPGAIMRHIWEGEKFVSLKIWAMYDQYS